MAARTLQAVFNERQQVQATKAQLLEAANVEVPRLTEARMGIEARIQMLEAQRSKLEALISARKAAEAQGRALAKIDVYQEFSAEDIMRSGSVAEVHADYTDMRPGELVAKYLPI